MGNYRKRQIQQNPDRRANRTILIRTLFLMGIFGVVAFVPLFVKLYQIQITEHEKYKQMAIDQQTRDSTVSANRGTIYDSKGTPLALSSTVYNVQLSPLDIRETQETYRAKVEAAAEKGKDPPGYPEPTDQFIADSLAEILGLDPEKILQRLAKTQSQYEIIKWRIEDAEYQAVLEFITENHLQHGIYLPPTTKRYYPYGSLAAQVIGWVNYNSDGKGAYGMEAIYEEELAGKTGRVVTAKNGRGTEMLYRFEEYYDGQDGNDLTLTIDATIQNFCASVLEEGIAEFEVQNGGFCIAMDPDTGAILAWANSPTYDLNSPWTVTDPVLSAYLEQVKNDPASSEEAYLEALGQAAWRNRDRAGGGRPGRNRPKAGA
ncbi:MAG: penicillin-binding protein, partial [Oscillospiraceae bacterium]|nr:penicillin-binding protein [Oscillospiraceae bacterium]